MNIEDRNFFSNNIASGMFGLNIPPDLVTSTIGDKTVVFSGADVNVVAVTPYNAISLDDLRVLSYSIHRAKTPVKVFGKRSPKGIARGYQLVAGTMVFLGTDKQPFYELLKTYDMVMKLDAVEYNKTDYTFPLPQQIYPFDLVVTFANEYGHYADLKIYGVDIIDLGETTSVDELALETQIQYIAMDIELRKGPDWDKWKQYGDTFYNLTNTLTSRGIIMVGNHQYYKDQIAAIEYQIKLLKSKNENETEIRRLEMLKEKYTALLQFYENLLREG